MSQTAGVALVGPAHPFKGGIAQHTTRTAHELAAAGHRTTLVSWYRQYPARLYPGVLTVPDDVPEMPVFAPLERRLAWNRPDSWVRAAWRLRHHSAVVFVVVNPIQLIAYHVMVAVLGRRVRTVALVHNVLPHEPSRVDRPLISAFLRRVDSVLVHTDAQAELARSLGAREVTVQLLPALLPSEPRRSCAPRTGDDDPLEVLFFGLVRPYKGVDLLIRAAAQVPQVRLTVAGELWVDASELTDLAASTGLGDRLTVLGGYVPADRLDDLFSRSHLVALPYRSATGSGNIRLALEQRVPVLVTRVGDLPDAVAGGVGVVCEPEDADSLAEGLRAVCSVPVLTDLQRAVDARPSTYVQEWADYVAALSSCAGLAR